jgi:hypothetical protein
MADLVVVQYQIENRGRVGRSRYQNASAAIGNIEHRTKDVRPVMCGEYRPGFQRNASRRCATF